MAELSDIEYIRSSVQFTSISDVSEINAYNKIKLDWKFDIYDTRDILSLTVMRVLLNPGEKANLNDPSIQKRFRTVLSWVREDDTAASSPPVSFTDEFQWDDFSDNNLHNLNYSNDLNWSLRKFRQVIQRICSGEQGIMYKIYGYSRRMNRAATPIGFFCDGNSIVALSQKNQMIKDKWYGECQQVWKATSDSGDGNFIRVAVDMTRDLSKQTGKERRVWASTTTGYVYCFDYWTGAKIGKKLVNAAGPVYALSYSPTVDRCVAGYSTGHEGKTYIKLLSEKISNGASTIEDKTTELPGGCPNDRITGGVCTTERTAGGEVSTPYFYMIFNKEMVMKYKLSSGSVEQYKRIAKDHFGCLSNDVTSDKYTGLALYPNQNNIYGIGAGINGQVWANGHTPVTVSSHVKKWVNSGKVNVKVKAGNGAGKGCMVVTEPRSAYGACASQYAAAFQSSQGVDLETLLQACPGFVNKHWGTTIDDWSDSRTHWVQAAWNYAASFIGYTRDAKYGKRYKTHGGCSVGLNSAAGVNYLNWIRTTKPYLIHDMSTSEPFTLDSVSHLPAGGPDNDTPEVIWLIHQEIISITPKKELIDVKIERPLMQDLNFIYGCNENENLFDTNGQFEDNGNALVYRRAISAHPAEYPSKFFKTMTNWCSAEYPLNQYGFAGRPYVFDWTSTGTDAPYSHTSDEIESVDKQVGKPHIPGYGYDAQVFNKLPGSATVIGVGNRKDIFIEELFRPQQDHGTERYCDVSEFSIETSSTPESAIPMSIGTLYSRMPNDGRMYIDRSYTDAYFTAKDKTANGFSYEVLFADRREGKIGFLKYKRPRSVGKASIDHIPSGDNRRLKYENNQDYEYYMDRGLANKLEFLDRAAYHVVVDSDNNIWTCSPKGISKLQLLTSAHGLEDKYVYDRNTGAGLMLYETENTLKESCIHYMNKHAKYGAKYENLYRDKGIENGEGPRNNSEYASSWKSGHELLTSVGMFTLESSGVDNLAYYYNYKEWQKAAGSPSGCWMREKIFNGDHFVWKRAYTRSSQTASQLGHANGGDVDRTKKWLGNQLNEYNDDNFGMNCLVQMNKVELGPDITYPVIKDPNAKSKITRSVSKSDNDVCDTQDGSAFWDSKTEIFNSDQSTSGYDNLDTTHFIYDIEQNYRHLIQHRYNYNDYSKSELETYFRIFNGESLAQPDLITIVRTHPFEYEDGTYDLIGLENVLDNWPEGVWLNPNYWKLVPPYGPLADLRYDHYLKRPLYVDLFIDYNPSVYNVFENANYETLQVGHHEIHLFERWPTGGFCSRGRGTDTMTDARTGINKMGSAYWGDCINDTNKPSSCSSQTSSLSVSDTREAATKKTSKRKTTKTAKKTKRKAK